MMVVLIIFSINWIVSSEGMLFMMFVSVVYKFYNIRLMNMSFFMLWCFV